MNNEQIVSEVENFYLENIYPACPKLLICKRNCHSFSTKPKMSYIGRQYGNFEEIPKLVFLSLDSGDEKMEYHTINEIRVGVETDIPQTFEKNKHWFQTFYIAELILAPFISDSFKKNNFFVNPFIVHTNSAKCTQNKDGRAMADDLLFDNCREYAINELCLLKPKIIITQGSKAELVLNHFKEIDRFIYKKRNIQLVVKVRMFNEMKAIHIHTYHPSYYRGYWTQKEIIEENIENITKSICGILTDK